MAASIRLLVNVNFAFLAVAIALFIVLIEIFVPYQNLNQWHTVIIKTLQRGNLIPELAWDCFLSLLEQLL